MATSSPSSNRRRFSSTWRRSRPSPAMISRPPTRTGSEELHFAAPLRPGAFAGYLCRVRGNCSPGGEARVHADDGSPNLDSAELEQSPAKLPILMQPQSWAMACLSVALTVGCATESRFVWVDQMPIATQNIEAIEPRDSILISVKNQPSLSGDFLVGDHGNYSQPTLGTIPVAGKTTDAVARELEERLKNIVVNPE